VTANSPDSAADTLNSAASTRADAHWEDANWICCAASVTVDITNSLYPEGVNGVTPLYRVAVTSGHSPDWTSFGRSNR
jgi:hypothetical protein